VEISIIMPCLNEAETLGTCITKAQNALRRHQLSGEVIVADNGSTDGSRQIAERMGARVVKVEPVGYGNALMGGMAVAKGQFVIMGDADDSYDFSAILPFVEKLRAGEEIVIGNRFRGGIRTGAMPLLHRWLGNPLLSFTARRLFGTSVGDIYCGLRGLDRRACEVLWLESPGMEFATEMIIKGALARLKIAEVPVVLDRDGRSRASHLRTWRDGWRTVRLMASLAVRERSHWDGRGRPPGRAAINPRARWA
jgi:glycosyltransferase involved in cell wall biosynthesis